MSNFAILRIAKIITLKGLSGASSHNTRTASSGVSHADNPAPLMGGGIRLVAGYEDANKAWHDRTQAVGLGRPRKDAVRALEAVMSASPAWFTDATKEERQEWLDKSLTWAAETFGKDNILSAHLHDDEQNPHCHFLIVPLAQKTRKKAGRPRKGRENQKRAAALSWGLSAADYIGSPEKLVELQTQYAAQVSHLGIRRGRSRRVTGAQHLSATTYRAQAADELAEAKAIRSEALNELNMAKNVEVAAQKKASEIVANTQASAVSTAAAFSIGLDAIDHEELTYSPSRENSPETLVWEEVDKPILPTKASAMRQWKDAARPFFGVLITYARRAYLLKARTVQLDARTAALSSEEKQLSTDAATVSRMLEKVGQPIAPLAEVRQRIRQKSR